MKMVLNSRLERGSMLDLAQMWPSSSHILLLEASSLRSQEETPTWSLYTCHTPVSESTELIREHSPCTGSHSSKHRDFPKLSPPKY